jgi:hypothetical protein
MSNRNNDVYSVLVTSGNAAILAEGGIVEDLAPGQLGFFDANRNTSIDATTTALPREFYIAVGIDRSGSGDLEDIRQSAGQVIQRRNVSNITFRPHTAGQPMIVNVGGYKATCDTDYGIRVEFRNSRIQRIQGYNQFSKAFVVRTGCCDGCAEGCDSYDPNFLSLLLAAEVNNDEANLILAEVVARQALTIATHGTSVNYAPGAVMTEADVQALITFNLTAADADKVFTDLKLTSIPLSINAFCQVNLGYHKLLETTLIVSLVEGFNCSGSTVVSQYPVYEEGSSDNVMQKEYHASGWQKSGPYKLSDVTGTAKGDIEFLAVKGTKYDQYTLQYTQTSESGWLEYENTLSTILAIPATETVTRNSVANVLNVLFTGLQFDSLVDEAAAADVDPTVIEPQPTDVDGDGIA